MTDYEVVMRYLFTSLSESERLKNLRIHQSNGKISINKPGEKFTTVMYVHATNDKVVYQRIVPRYVGELHMESIANPHIVDKIIDELFGVPAGAF